MKGVLHFGFDSIAASPSLTRDDLSTAIVCSYQVWGSADSAVVVRWYVYITNELAAACDAGPKYDCNCDS